MSSSSRFTIFVLIVVIAGALAAGYLWWQNSKLQPQPTPSPTVTASVTPTPTATPTSSPETALILIEEGKVQVTHENSDTMVEEQSTVFVGDKIKTFPDSKATIIFPDNDVLRLDNNTEITLLDLVSSDTDAKVKIEQNFGNTWSRVESILDKKREYSVETPTLVATVRGTVFNVDATSTDESWVGVTESTVDVERKQDNMQLPVSAGNFSLVKKGIQGKSVTMVAEKLDDTKLGSKWFKDNFTKDQKIRDILGTLKNKKLLEKNFLRNNNKLFFEKIKKTELETPYGSVLPTTGITFDPQIAFRDVLSDLVLSKAVTPEEANGMFSDPYVHQKIITMTTNEQIAAFADEYIRQMRNVVPGETVKPTTELEFTPTPTSLPTIIKTPLPLYLSPQYFYNLIPTSTPEPLK